MERPKDYYALLGVPRDASPAAIKRAYRRLTTKQGPAGATVLEGDTLAELQAAYETLTDAERRRRYDAALASLVSARSRHNTYMSVPLLWGMISQHTTWLSGGNLGIPSEWSFVVFLVATLVGWHVVWQLYRRAGKVKGF